MPYEDEKSIIRIAYAEDDLTLQELMPKFLDGTENFKVMMQALDGKDLLEKLNRNGDIDLVLLDIRMPKMNGYEAAKIIKKDFPEIKILFSSKCENDLVYCLLIDAGADGFIRKGHSTADLKKAIRETMRNGGYFPNFPVSLSKKKMKIKSHVSHEEIVFMKLICTGLTYPAIAAKMQITERHAEYVREGLFEKFSMHNRAELALFAYNSGIFY